MDRKLTEEFTQALRTLEDAEKHTREAQETVKLLRSRWNAELRSGDVVGDPCNGKCEVVTIADDTIEIVMVDRERRGIKIDPRTRHTPINQAPIYPWTDSDETKHQLDVVRRALVNHVYHLPAEALARIKEIIKSS